VAELADLWQLARTPEALAVLEAAWVAAASAWVLLERRPPASTLAWILALAFLPVVGVAVYLLLGPRRLDRKKLRMALARELPQVRELGHLVATSGAAPPRAVRTTSRGRRRPAPSRRRAGR
jgi:cardiolipin synthase A/B